MKIERKTELNMEEFSVSVTFKRIRNMHLYVKAPDGQVEVTAPFFLSLFEVERFVQSKMEWVKRERKKVLERSSEENPNAFLPMNKKVFGPLLLEEAKDYFEKWEKVTGLHPSSYYVRDMKTRWGTCNVRTGRICLNLRLYGKPDEWLSYVVLHELAHLKYANHGPEFKRFLSRYMPDWQKIRKEMNLT